MKLATVATNNISHGEITVEAEPQWLVSIPSRRFTGRFAYSYEVGQKKNKSGDETAKVRVVPESSLEQWLFGQLSSLANRIMNANRYKAVSVDEETGEVSDPAWATLDVQTLAQSLTAAVPERVIMEDWEWGTWKRRNPNAVGRTHLHEMCQRIAVDRHQTWDAEYLDKVRARARENGTKSKRPKDITVFQVLGFPFADHSTPEAKRVIAAALSKTPRTVERRLKDWRDGHSEWTPTSASRYLSQPEGAPTSAPRYLSRGDRLMALPFEDRPRQKKSEPVDWTFLLELPTEASAAPAVEPQHEDIIVSTLTEQTVNSFYAEFYRWEGDIVARARGHESIGDELAALFDELPAP